MPEDFQKRKIPQICLRKALSGNAGPESIMDHVGYSRTRDTMRRL